MAEKKRAHDPDVRAVPAEGFAAPRIAITRVYTRTGDTGMSALCGGQRVSKAHPRIEAYGQVDELNAFIGLVRDSLEQAAAAGSAHLGGLARVLCRVQHELFNAGSILATLPEDVHPKQARITEGDITALEHEIDRCNAVLAALRSFVLPGGTRINAELHIARTVCRRAERAVVALSAESEIDPLVIHYLNRLSDALFVWSRWVSHVAGAPESLWDPNYKLG